MGADDIVTRLRAEWLPSQGSTHYEGCVRSHPDCAVQVLCDEIERLRGTVARAAEMIRIKDELIGKQSSRITFLEARRD